MWPGTVLTGAKGDKKTSPVRAGIVHRNRGLAGDSYFVVDLGQGRGKKPIEAAMSRPIIKRNSLMNLNRPIDCFPIQINCKAGFLLL